MDDDDQESPSPSPVPGPSRQYPDEIVLEDHDDDDGEAAAAGEAQAYQPRDQEDIDLAVAGPSYRYLSDDGRSPAPSHSGLDPNYDLIGVQPGEASLSLSRQFDDVFSSSSPPCSSSSSNNFIQSSFPTLPSTSAPRPGHSSSDPVFSAHSQALPSELLSFSQPGPSSQSSDWDSSGHDLPISSSWGVTDAATGQSSSGQYQLRPGPSGWDADTGQGLPGPSGLEQAVPGQLSLEGDDQDTRDIQWSASSSSGLVRHIDYNSEDNSMEAEAQQSYNNFPAAAGIEASSYSPQPSSSGSNGSVMNNRVASMNAADQSLVNLLTSGPRHVRPQDPGQSDQVSNVSSFFNNKRPRSFPDSPTSQQDQAKRPRVSPDEEQPDDEIIVLPAPLVAAPSRSDLPVHSVASQINREIENCLREEEGLVSRSTAVVNLPGTSGVSSRSQASRMISDNSPQSSNMGFISFGPGPSRMAQPGPSSQAGSSNSLVSMPPRRVQPGPNSPTGSEVRVSVPVNFGAGPSRAYPGPPSPTGSDVIAPVSFGAGPSRVHQGPPSPTGSDVIEAGPVSFGAGPSRRTHGPPSPTGSDVIAPISFGAGPSRSHHGPPSPTGSDVIAAGPSRADDDIQINIELQDSPSGSEVGAAGSSHPPSVADNNPDSPAPSESDPDEPGPSNRGGFMVRFGPAPPVHEREAAPVGRSVSPVNRQRARRNLSDSCLISSSTGPVDDDPPTPEMFGVSGDIDSDYSPALRRYNYRIDDNEADAVVDSTVDSTNLPFVLNDYDGNEVFQHDDDSSEDESVAGSEASSSTSAHRIDDQRLTLPGQDDNEGISTSGQVDVGQFRLVPNEDEIILEEFNLTNPASQPIAIVPQQQHNPTFKKPFSRKDQRSNDNPYIDPVPGPSGLQNRSANDDDAPEESQATDSASSENQPDQDSIILQDDYSNSINIGMAFSALPSSLSLERISGHNQQENQENSSEKGEKEKPKVEDTAQAFSSNILRNSLETGRPSNGALNFEPQPGPSGINNLPEPEEEKNDLGGVQQQYSVTLETSNLYLSSVKPRNVLPPKSAAELKEYLPLDEDSFNDNDLELGTLESVLNIEPSPLLENPLFVSPKKRTAYEYTKQQTESQENISITISDQPVQSRAVASLPSNYLNLRTVGSSQAVFAARNIPVSCRFGPMEGRLRDPSSQDVNSNIPLALIIQGQRLDVSSEEDSNWMRFIRPASTTEEQNLELHEVNGQLYFSSTREIHPDEELRVWYSEQYATQHSLPSKPVKPQQKNTALISPTIKQHIAEKNKKDSGGPSYTCEICQRKFERQASLLRHLALHKGDKNYSCDQCGQKFSHTFNLERHKKKAHNTDPAGQYVCCSVCSIWFPSNMVLKVHMFSHHPNKEEQNWTVEDAMAQSGKSPEDDNHEEMKFQCPSEGCECQYDTWLQLVEHAMEHGLPALPGSEETNNVMSTAQKCELCYKTFANDERLKKHMTVHAGDENKPLECADCGKRFLTNSALAGHIKTHAHPDTMYDCPICGLAFEQVSSLKDHVYIHKENGVFTCPHCQKTFTEYPNIRKHIRAFHAQKKFPCTICDKTFPGKDKLKIHMVKHSEIKEFSCDECGKEFKRRDKLKEHIKRLHSNPAPAAAAKKEKEQEEALVDQEANTSRFVPKVSPTELHRFIYKCQTCMLGFKRRGMLVNHLAKRHPNVTPSSVPELNLPILKTTKDFYCQYCDKVYKSSSKRKSHILKNHPGAPLPAGARDVGGDTDASASTFSQAVGSVPSEPHNCDLCHKQYASKAKLLQHMRKEHRGDQSAAGPSTSTKGERPKEVLYLNSPSPLACPADAVMGESINLGNEDLFPDYGQDFILDDQSNGAEDVRPSTMASEGDSLAGEARQDEIISVVDNQEFILLQPGPSTATSSSDMSSFQQNNDSLLRENSKK